MIIEVRRSKIQVLRVVDKHIGDRLEVKRKATYHCTDEETYTYANFHFLLELLQGAPNTIHQNVWFTRTFFDSYHVTHRGRWIECGGSVVLSSRFLDLTLLDFFFLGHLKSIGMSVVTVKVLAARIFLISADIAR
ncbi:hypothetical protein TNCV_1463261 [Trichonephila clavipes]|uniref:Uncharacterized protein n=1 Tax=Trichonephila clavipes TaxID=2585209 RepID=A0A8X6SC38_TRICX|nr:hypothetical protein TNCV_1463261 [Trichonephila clavipes]